jgi:hypothetical protein
VLNWKPEIYTGIAGKHVGDIHLGPIHVQGLGAYGWRVAVLRAAVGAVARVAARIHPIGRCGQNQGLSRIDAHDGLAAQELGMHVGVPLAPTVFIGSVMSSISYAPRARLQAAIS